jgi:uncharacterized protein YihD (DUF1040 family)
LKLLNYISNASECSLRKFMQAWFEEKYSVLIIEGEVEEEILKTAFEKIHLQYVDLSGLGQTHELQMRISIHYLTTRITVIKTMLFLHREFIKNFDVPFLPGLIDFKKYGHSVYWDNDKEAFLIKLNQIEIKESKFQAQLDAKMKELIDYHNKIKNKQHAPVQSRKEFIRNMNTLNRSGYSIDKDQTMVDEYSLMLNDLGEEREQLKVKK